jgi:hypothetical protein
MFKKLFSTIALTSLLVGGLSVGQAYAEAPNVDTAKVQGAEARFAVDLGQATQFVVPAGLTNVEIGREFEFAESFLVARQGQTLGYRFTITQPNGSTIPVMGMGPGISYSKNINGRLMSSQGGPAVQANDSTGELVVPANATDYTGYLNTSMYLYAGAMGSTLPAGTYTFSLELTSFGGIQVVPSNSVGLTVSGVRYRYSVPGTSFTTPQAVLDASVSGNICLDTSKVAAGEIVTAAIVHNGVLDANTDNSWRTQTGFKRNGDPGYRDTYSSSITITPFDLAWGVYVRLNKYLPAAVAGSNHEIAFRFYNQANEDVSSNCAPAKPTAPSLSPANGGVAVTGNFAIGSSAMYESQCVVYDSAAPTVAVRTVSAYRDFQDISKYSCNIFGLTSGKTYLVKFRDRFMAAYSEFSEASQILIPAAGFTVNKTYAGVAEAKKIVEVSNNVLPIEDFAPYTNVVPDGKGGFYYYGEQQGACPPLCGTQKLRIRHASATALDSSFGGTGTVLFESITVPNAYVGGVGYYSESKDKWAAAVNGVNFQTQPPVGETQIIFGSATSAATTSKTLTQSSVNTVCAAASAGYATAQSQNMEISVIPAPVDNALLSINCFKSFTFQGRSSFLPLTVLATIDSATGALTYVAKMAEPGASLNYVSTRFSVNPNASGSEAMLTAFVTTSLVTQVNNYPMTNVGTITDHTVIRFNSDLGFLTSTSAAWGSSGGTIADDPNMSIPDENTGKIFAVRNAGLTADVITFDGASVGTVRSVDLSQSAITSPQVTVLGGQAAPSNETVLPVAVMGTNQEAAGWINLETGVLTTGEVLNYTVAPGNGFAHFWLRGSDKNSYLVYSDSAAPANLTVLKWMDLSYVAQTVSVQQTVTVAALAASVRVGDADLALSATVTFSPSNAGTAGAITWTSETPNVCSIVDNKARLLTAGTCTVKATAAASGNLLAGSGTQSTTVSAAAVVTVAQIVTVAALAASVRVGDPDLALSATVTFSPSNAGTAGAITWTSETPNVCSIVANKARLLTAGTCTVKATAAASGNLLAGSGTQSTTVSAAAVVTVAQIVTVAALAASVRVGDPDLALSATVTFSPSNAGTAGAITWTSETPTVCSIVANKARLLTAGTCTVKATAAASGNLLAGSGTQSTTVSAAAVVAAAQTVTLTGPTRAVVDLDGFEVVSSASSGLPVVYATTTPAICTVTAVGLVVAIAVGTCEITSSQAGNASWLAATKTLTITVAKTPTAPVTEKGDIKKPLALSKTGTFLKNGDTQLGWNRSKGTLTVKLSVVYVGPVKASVSFKVGSKTFTCTSSFGILKKQSSNKQITLTSPNLCTGKTEKTQLAALKKITPSTVVTVTIVRDMYLPTTYKKIRTKTRILYAKLG